MKLRDIGRLLKVNGTIYTATGPIAAAAMATLPFSPSGKAYMAVARQWGRLLCGVTGIDLQLRETASVNWSRPLIVMSNHASLFDVPILFAAIPTDLRFLSKHVLAYIPVFGWSMWMAGFIFINRSNPIKARESIDAASEAIRSGRSIVIFPEGTRSEDGRLMPFKKGGFVLAVKTGVPVVPVYIHGSHEILPKNSIITQPGRVEVRVGRPIDASGHSLETKEALMDAVREELERLAAL